MISRLDARKYTMAEPAQYLIYLPSVDSGIDPVFEGRLAAFAKAYKSKLSINSGYRSAETQIQLFLAQGGKYDPKLGYYWPVSIQPQRHTVAKPGRSFHNFRLAIDTNSPWAKQINKVEATTFQKELLKFGIFKPITKGNGCAVLEDWHIQPIETLNLTLEQRKDMMPIDDRMKPFINLKRGMKGDAVGILQFQLNKYGYMLSLDFDFGMLTESAVKDFQRIKGINAKGIVGQKTWDKLYEV
jgi:hypothetical protein